MNMRVGALSFAAALVALAACTKGVVYLGAGASSPASCHGEGGSNAQAQAITDPPSIDRGKAIADLTDAEAEAWCTWYAGLHWLGEPVAPPPADQPVSADGTVAGDTGLIWGVDPRLPEESMCVTRLSIHQCVQNLRYEGCGATVGDLDACAEALVFECIDPRPWCDPYLDICSETVVVRPDLHAGGCRLPVQ
jgi:hypothetical protein